jgi:hypothetical protein
MNLVFASSFQEAAVATMALPLIAYIALLLWFSKSYKKVSGPVTMPARRHVATAVADAGPGQSSETAAADAVPALDTPPGPETQAEGPNQAPIEPDSPLTPEGDGALPADDAD